MTLHEHQRMTQSVSKLFSRDSYLGFIYIAAKAKVEAISGPDGFIENPI